LLGLCDEVRQPFVEFGWLFLPFLYENEATMRIRW
jgi:hypothetical protein